MKREELEKAQTYLRNNVTGIVEKMTIDIMLQKPDDTVGYMIDWLEDKGPEVQKQFKRKVMYRPEGVDTSESSEDEVDDTVLEISKKRPTYTQQRKSVSAEVFGQFNPKTEFKLKVVPKTDAVKQQIRELLIGIFMFKNLEEKDMQTILNSMEVKEFAKDDMVITQDDDGDELFIVGNGSLNCFKRFSGTNKDTFLKQYQKGEVFGELALLYNLPRAASIQANQDSVLYSLNRDCFNNIVKESAMKNRLRYEEFLSQVEVLQSLDTYERSKLCDCLTITDYNKDQYVIKEGEKGNTFFLVLEGTAVAMKWNQNTLQEEEVYNYNEKMYFGELSLLRDQPRAASIIAKVSLSE
jgi:cAMP-dependent protein kinase regulator